MKAWEHLQRSPSLQVENLDRAGQSGFQQGLRRQQRDLMATALGEVSDREQSNAGAEQFSKGGLALLYYLY